MKSSRFPWKVFFVSRRRVKGAKTFFRAAMVFSSSCLSSAMSSSGKNFAKGDLNHSVNLRA